MRIGIVTTWFERGAAYVSRAYWQALSPPHEVFIYARGGEKTGHGDPKWDLPNVAWGKTIPGRVWSHVDWEDFSQWVEKYEIDTVVFNEQNSWDIIIRALELDITIGAYVDYYTPESVPLFSLYDFLLCNTRRHFSVFKSHPQALYVPWGTDTELFRPLERPAEDADIVFFHSAGMNPYRKGTDLLIEAFQQVRGNARLVIHTQEPLATAWPTPRYGNLAKRDSRIQVINKEVGAPGLYYLGDVYVYPTRLEGIGLTVAEAMASGLPVITTDNQPMNEFVIDGVNGRLVTVEKYQPRPDGYYWPQAICDRTALIRAMQHFVDNPQRLREYQQQARQHAVANLTWQKNSAQLSQLFQQLSRTDRDSKGPILSLAQEYERSLYRRYPRVLRRVLDNPVGRRIKGWVRGY